MKEPTALQYEESGFFVWRSPTLPFDDLLRWGQALQAPKAGPGRDRIDLAVEADRTLLRERLREIVSRPVVHEALFIASPDLEQRLGVWLAEPDGVKGRRIELAVVRYFERMTARATPFGLFSGCALGRIGDETVLELEDARCTRRHSRLDTHYLTALAETLESDPGLRRHLTFTPNSSLYRAAGRWRYAEARTSGTGRDYHLVAVDAMDYLEAALVRARTGATLAEIGAAICHLRPDVTSEEAEEFVEELIDSQMLVSDLSPYVTGVDPVSGLITELRRHDVSRPIADVLARTRATLTEIDTAGPGVACERYHDIASRLETLPAPVELPRLVQVDLVKPCRASKLGARPLSDIKLAVEILLRLDPPQANQELARFRDAFLARFEEREVALADVLDSEVGIGFGAPDTVAAHPCPLLANLGIRSGGQTASEQGPWRPAHDLLLQKLLRAYSDRTDEILLEESDLDRLPSTNPALPPAIGVAATIAARSVEDVQHGDYRLLFRGVGGPSGANLLGRFCHTDARLRERVAEHLRREESHATDAIFAEVTHLPEGRLGNILFRPVLRDHEIPFLGRSGAPSNAQIPLQDLVVSVSMGRVVLRSRRLGREVVPRLTSAHNFSRDSLPIYRFLCTLQSQGMAAGIIWSWGPLQSARFLPRVRFGRVVFCRAKWSLEDAEVRALGSEEPSDRFLRVQRWRESRRMPRFVVLGDADNELLVDLDNTLSIDAFADIVKNRNSVVLTEMFPRPDELVARGPEGRFVHEIIVPLVQKAPQRSDTSHGGRVSSRRPDVDEGVERTFAPGSEWLYARIFTGTSTADRILLDALAPLVGKVAASRAADRWFFIRYSDPEWHLRLRFHGAPDRLTREVLPALHASLEPLRKNGLLWRLQLDTYERESERYGGDAGIVLVEKLFQIDSEATLDILAMLDGDEGADARWRIALYGMDRILGDFGLSLAQKLEVATRSRDAFGEEFGVGKGVRVGLGNRFRAERNSLTHLLGGKDHEQPELRPALDVLRTRSDRVEPIVTDLRRQREEKRLSIPLEQVAGHLTHMFLNRLLLSAHRAQELVLWDFLGRIYESRSARRRTRQAGTELQRSVI